jgi:hypothetical protein
VAALFVIRRVSSIMGKVRRITSGLFICLRVAETAERAVQYFAQAGIPSRRSAGLARCKAKAIRPAAGFAEPVRTIISFPEPRFILDGRGIVFQKKLYVRSAPDAAAGTVQIAAAVDRTTKGASPFAFVCRHGIASLVRLKRHAV